MWVLQYLKKERKKERTFIENYCNLTETDMSVGGAAINIIPMSCIAAYEAPRIRKQVGTRSKRSESVKYLEE